MESHSSRPANIDQPLRVTSPAIAKLERNLLLLPENQFLSLLRAFKLPTSDQKSLNDFRPLLRIFNVLDNITKKRKVLAIANTEMNEDLESGLLAQEEDLRTKMLINQVKDANLMDIHRIDFILKIASKEKESRYNKSDIDRLLMLRQMMRSCIVGKSLDYNKKQIAILHIDEVIGVNDTEQRKYAEIDQKIITYNENNISFKQQLACMWVDTLFKKTITFIDKTIQGLGHQEMPTVSSRRTLSQGVLLQRAVYRHQLISVRKAITDISTCFVYDANQTSKLTVTIEKLQNLKKEAKASQLGLTSKTRSYLQTGFSLLFIVPAILRSIHNKITYGTGKFWKSSLYKESKLAEKRVEKSKKFFFKL